MDITSWMIKRYTRSVINGKYHVSVKEGRVRQLDDLLHGMLYHFFYNFTSLHPISWGSAKTAQITPRISSNCFDIWCQYIYHTLVFWSYETVLSRPRMTSNMLKEFLAVPSPLTFLISVWTVRQLSSSTAWMNWT